MDKPFDPVQAITSIRRFLSGYLDRSGLGGYVLGLSGGVDSALAAALAAAAIGPKKVLAVLMPYRTSSADSRSDGLRLAAQLSLPTRLIDISPMIDAYFPVIDASNRVRAGNKMARERMAILFDIAHETGLLVLGTGNRTEICLGYTTWHGDSACSVNPIGELYKSEVRQLSRLLEIPDAIIDKPPTADLWADQTDEGEIGVTYDALDAILRRIVDDGVTSMAALERDGHDPVAVSRVVSLMNRNAFKRALPAVAPLGRRAVPQYVQLDV